MLESRFFRLSTLSLLGALAAACSDDGGSTGGSGAAASGVGGAQATGGTSTGGAQATGGEPATGGASTGGVGTGGVGTGGVSTGGVGTGGSSVGGSWGAPIEPGETFRVSGRHLYDRCGEQVVLRGVNEMIVWSGGRDGVPEYSEIAKTGANVVRIVWNEEGSAAELDVAIQNAVAEQLIPMIEHHSATGDLTKVPEVVDYWVQSDVVSVLKKHEAYLLLNIANEAAASPSEEDFRTTYETAITRIRDTGVKMPLIIDGSSWGQDIDMLQAVGPDLMAHDPEGNVLFSVHMWWSDPQGTRVKSELQESVDMGLPLIVGEFAQHAVYLCDQSPFAYTVLMEEAKKHQIGWLAWSWGGVQNNDCANEGSFDMTVGGVFGNWEETWGEEVAVTDPNSIQNTSIRPASMVNGSCE